MKLQPTAAMKTATMCAAILALGTGSWGQDGTGHAPEYPRLFIFFTPSDPLASCVRRLELLPSSPRIRIVPQLLLSDSRSLTADLFLSKTFVESIRALEQALGEGRLALSICNTEGLALARRFAVKATPAFVYARDQGHAHVAYGTDPNFEELVSCRKK